VARIFLIDSHPSVRKGLRLLLAQASHTVCGEAGCGRETVQRIGPSGADLAILELSLGEGSGLDLIPGMRLEGIRVLVYSFHEDAETIEKAFAAGAGGYVSKREADEALIYALTDLEAGRRHISPRAALRLAGRVLARPRADR
jgi:DNA-binding NarL/FixJ family response regulator